MFYSLSNYSNTCFTQIWVCYVCAGDVDGLDKDKTYRVPENSTIRSFVTDTVVPS